MYSAKGTYGCAETFKAYCSTLIEYDGWEIKDDYPWQVKYFLPNICLQRILCAIIIPTEFSFSEIHFDKFIETF